MALFRGLIFLFFGASLAGLAGCFTDAATRLAYDIKAGEARLGRESGATYRIVGITPARRGECAGPYTVQFDRVGAIIVWCADENGHTVSSHSTSYHRRYVDTAQTFLLKKPAGATLTLVLERRGDRAIVTDIR